MKTLIFNISLLLCGLNSVAQASDLYDGLAWEPVDPAVASLTGMPPATLSLAAFRHYFRRRPLGSFRELVKECGVPADQWGSDRTRFPNQQVPSPMPIYYAGHLFRYQLADGGRVYVWTGEADARVMRADYFSDSGRVMPLYKFSP